MIRRLGLLIVACACIPGAGLAYNAYFASMHGHTSLSDGTGTPAEAYAYARDVANIDVLALTEHTHMLTQYEWTNLLSTAASFTEDGVFVAFGAQEFGNLNDFGHMNIFDCLYRNPNPTDNLLATYSFIRDTGAFGVFNHPNPQYGTNFNNLAFYAGYVNQMIGIEVRNGLRIDDYETQYIQALDNGWHLAPFANQDNHDGHWGDQPNPSMGGDIYLTGILADELTAGAVLSALRSRRVYAMEVNPPTDRIALEFYANGQIMGQEVVSGAHLTLTGSAVALNGSGLFVRAELYEDGVVVADHLEVATTISWVFDRGLADGESHYYFVRVSQVDGDKTWSAPVWVTADVDPASTEDNGEGSVARLLPCFPNPFDESTTVRFQVPGGSPQAASIAVLDLQGRLVREMPAREYSAGFHQWAWDGRDEGGSACPSGLYFVELRLDGSRAETGRVVLSR